MKKLTKLAAVAGLCASAGVQAAATSDVTITIDWETLSIAGPLGSPVAFNSPLDGFEMTSAAEGWVESVSGGDSTLAFDGASAIAIYSVAAADLRGGYDAAANTVVGEVSLNNTDGGELWGWAGGYQGFFYEASASGEVTVSVGYSLVGGTSATNDGVSYANIGYDLYGDAVDAALWSTTYLAAIDGGQTEVDAMAAADAAALLAEYQSSWTEVAVSFGCGGALCTNAVNETGTMSMTFNVMAGTTYAFGFDATAGGYTISPVPETSTYAMMLAGLGMIGFMARRRAHVPA